MKPYSNDGTERFFEARLSPFYWFMTFVLGFGVGIGGPIVVGVFLWTIANSLLVFAPAVMLCTFFFFLHRYRPTGFLITDKTIEVVRPAGNVRIALDQVRAVRSHTDLLSFGSFGLLRNSGVFGRWGLYYRAGVGLYRVYITDDSHAVEIELINGKRFVLSPDPKPVFLMTLKAVVDQWKLNVQVDSPESLVSPK